MLEGVVSRKRVRVEKPRSQLKKKKKNGRCGGIHVSQTRLVTFVYWSKTRGTQRYTKGNHSHNFGFDWRACLNGI